VKLHLGCGLNAQKGWVNVDGSWGVLLAKYQFLRRILRMLRIFPEQSVSIPWDPSIVFHDLRKKLPFASASVGMIYCAHTLEHLYLDQARRLLEDCFRVLAPGGILRMVVPDLKAMALNYVAPGPRDGSTGAKVMPADVFVEGLLLRAPSLPGRTFLHRLYYAFNDFQSHKWMYDADSLRSQFELAGFMKVQSMPYRESKIDDIDKVEQEGRHLDGPEIYIEGVKPF